ncbi:hypothetical protein GGR54DRAFT_301197 [Hypoxylon sp. NC1633]|nr:hypothetical protein GGR54DRAFT_301197 [Hypoxylon sp. NC1633]
MDPLTVIQIVGTVISVGDVVIRCITRLSSLKAKYHDAPIVVSTMMGQLYMVQTALDQLSVLESPELYRSPRYQHLALQVNKALDSFSPLMMTLQRDLDRLAGRVTLGMAAKNRLVFLWSEKEMTMFSMLLDRQVNALNLLLQAIQCQTWAQQQEVISRSESQSILQLAKDNSSIVALDEKAGSVAGDTDAVSTTFDFDDTILRSRLYQDAQRSHFIQAIRAVKPPESDTRGSSTNIPLQEADAILANSHDDDQDTEETAQASDSLEASIYESPTAPELYQESPSPSPSPEARMETNNHPYAVRSNPSTTPPPEEPGLNRLIRQPRSFRLGSWWKGMQRREDDTGTTPTTEHSSSSVTAESEINEPDPTLLMTLQLEMRQLSFKGRGSRRYYAYLDLLAADSGLSMASC